MLPLLGFFVLRLLPQSLLGLLLQLLRSQNLLCSLRLQLTLTVEFPLIARLLAIYASHFLELRLMLLLFLPGLFLKALLRHQLLSPQIVRLPDLRMQRERGEQPNDCVTIPA